MKSQRHKVTLPPSHRKPVSETGFNLCSCSHILHCNREAHRWRVVAPEAQTLEGVQNLGFPALKPHSSNSNSYYIAPLSFPGGAHVLPFPASLAAEAGM